MKNSGNKNAKTKKITRKEAIKKVSWTALTASTMIFLETKAYASTSEAATPNNPNRNQR